MNMIFAIIEAFLINKTYKKLQKLGVIKEEEVIPIRTIFDILKRMNEEMIKGDEKDEREQSQKNTVQ